MRVGGFAPSYCRPCIEDIEFGYRLNQHGGTIGVDKSLQVKHLKHWDAASLLRSDFFDRAIPWSELILQRGGFVNDLNLSHANRLSVALSLLLAVALPAGLFYPGAWPVAAMAVVGLLVLNAELLLFFRRRRGTAFALRVIPWHWFQFVYSGAAFGWVAARTLLQRLRARGKRARRSFTRSTAAPAPGRQDPAPAPAALEDELVSVVVPAYNAQDTIADCLRSLAAQEGARQLQVIVVDSSQDRTAEIVAEQFPWVELLRHARRQDPGRARNQGLAAAKGAVVAFIDADCRAHPRWVQRLRQAHAMGRPVVGVRWTWPRDLPWWAGPTTTASLAPGCPAAGPAGLATSPPPTCRLTAGPWIAWGPSWTGGSAPTARCSGAWPAWGCAPGSIPR